jgi:hypothetical protein
VGPSSEEILLGDTVIGFLAGLGLLISYLGAAWTVDTSEDSLFSSGLGGAFVILGVFTVVGIFLFPRTVGTAFTPMSFATPIAFLIALLRHGFGYSLFILAVGVGAWLVTFIVGTVRPDAT